MEKVIVGLTEEEAKKDLEYWLRDTRGKARMEKQEDGKYAIYADTRQLSKEKQIG